VAAVTQIRIEKSAPVFGGLRFANSESTDKYSQTFAEFGLTPGKMEPALAAKLIQAKRPTVQAALIAALDDWFRETPSTTKYLQRDWLRQVVQAADPDATRNRMRLAVANSDGKVLQKAADDPDILKQPPPTLELLGSSLDNLKAKDSAVRLLRQAQAQYPADFWLAQSLAQILRSYRLAPQRNEAIFYYRIALALQPRNILVRRELAGTLREQGQLDDAVVELRRAVAVDSTLAVLHSDLASALRAQGQVDEAVDHCRTAVALDPTWALPHAELASALAAQGRWEEVIPVARKAIQLNSNFDSAHYDLINALEKLGKRDELPIAYYNLGNTLRQLIKVDDAIAAYQKAVELRPDYAWAYERLGSAQCVKANWEQVVSACRHATQLDYSVVPAHFSLGYALQNQGKYAEAIAAYNKVIELNPNYPFAYFNLGGALRRVGKLDEAVAAYRKAGDVQPDYPWIQNELGDTLRRQGKWDESLAALRKAEQLAPKHPVILKNRQRTMTWQELDQKLPALLSDVEKTHSASEKLELAALCFYVKHFYRQAANLYEEAFRADETLAATANKEHRYDAACAALLAATGQGLDSSKLDDSEKTALRRQSLNWLRADLVDWDKQLQQNTLENRNAVQQTLNRWQRDDNLLSVREPAALQKLPDPEQNDWEKLWADVTALLQRAQGKK
jgi:tetratricopeptide (TPR) repeat protein